MVSAVHGHVAGVGVLKWTAGLGPAAAVHAQLVASPLLLAVPPAAETGGGQRTLVVGFEDRGIAVSGE